MVISRIELLKQFDDPSCPIWFWDKKPASVAKQLLTEIKNGMIRDVLWDVPPVSAKQLWTSQLMLTDAGRDLCGIKKPVEIVPASQRGLFDDID